MTTWQKAVLVWGCSALGLATADQVLAQGRGPSPWHCPYYTDGNCAPRRQLYGHYAPKWTRWPGVDDTLYRSQSDRNPRAFPTPPPDTGPRIAPPDLMLPPTDLPTLDAAPRPPRPEGDGDAMGPPSLFEEEEKKPSVLAPNEENVLDELLPPANGDAAPAPPQRDTPQPEATPPANKTDAAPKEGDPFLDDPLFEDDAPAPPTRNQTAPGASTQPGLTIPAAGTAPLSESNQHGGEQANWRLGSVAQRASTTRAAQQVAHWETIDSPEAIEDDEPPTLPTRQNALRAGSAQPSSRAAAAQQNDFRVEPGQKPATEKPPLKWRANPLR